MGPFPVVADEVLVERHLHLVDGLEPGASSFDPEVLVEQRAVEPLHDTVRLGPVDLGGAMLNVLELQEQLVGVAVGSAAELPSVVREHHLDAPASGLEGGQHVVVHQVHGGHRHLVRIEPCPAMARVAIDGGLQVHLAHAFERADKEGVHGHQRSRCREAPACARPRGGR